MKRSHAGEALSQCRLVVIEGQSRRILTIITPSGPQLPRESLAVNTRIAEALTKAVELRYGMQTIQLALLDERGNLDCVAVHEIVEQKSSTTKSLSFLFLQDVAEGELAEWERALILKIMNGEAHGLGRFARCGWIAELLAITCNHRSIGGKVAVKQLNQGIDYCLLSLQHSSGTGLWFKALGDHNSCEYALTLELARRFPRYLPRIVTTIPKWNGWVMEEAAGVPLSECDSIVQCENSLAALALMQREMASEVDHMLALGAKDWRCVRIEGMLDPFFEEVRVAMEAQTSNKAKPLSCDELGHLKQGIGSALREFMSMGVPETLLHGDIGHGNIIAGQSGPIFLDWAETYVGHPFLSAEHLLADLARSNPVFSAGLARLRSSYATHWRDIVRPKALGKTITLAPAVAALAYALFAWDANRARPDPALAWPLLRTMIRYTKRALESVPEVHRESNYSLD